MNQSRMPLVVNIHTRASFKTRKAGFVSGRERPRRKRRSNELHELEKRDTDLRDDNQRNTGFSSITWFSLHLFGLSFKVARLFIIWQEKDPAS